MPAPTNRMSYRDVYDVFDKALEDPRGIRLPFTNHHSARAYQMRMNSARAVDRKENLRAFPVGDPMHGQSTYDILAMRIRNGEDGTVFLYIEPKDKNAPEIESLSEIEGEGDQI